MAVMNHSRKLPNARYCPQCKELVEAYTRDYAYWHHDLYGIMMPRLVVGADPVPDGYEGQVVRATQHDRFTLHPCDHVLSGGEFNECMQGVS